jgi:hypothetical protein
MVPDRDYSPCGRAMLRRTAVGMALGCLIVPLAGCRRGATAPPAPPPQPAQQVGPAHQFIVDRETRVYHRPNCPSLPPAERRVRIDRRMLELTRSLHTPCEVCKPDGPPASSQEQSMPGPPAEGPPPPSAPTVEPDDTP